MTVRKTLRRRLRPAGEVAAFRTSHQDELQEPADPFRAADRLPDRRYRDRRDDYGRHQGHREQELILLEIGEPSALCTLPARSAHRS